MSLFVPFNRYFIWKLFTQIWTKNLFFLHIWLCFLSQQISRLIGIEGDLFLFKKSFLFFPKSYASFIRSKRSTKANATFSIEFPFTFPVYYIYSKDPFIDAFRGHKRETIRTDISLIAISVNSIDESSFLWQAINNSEWILNERSRLHFTIWYADFGLILWHPLPFPY